MPTERFFRLSVAKQNIIKQAAAEEFARVPYEKVSINKIIQKADISRGSFYTYFEDKRDLLRYIFLDIKDSICKFCQESIQRTEGSLWGMMEELFDFCTIFFNQTIYVQLFKNVSAFPDAEELLGFTNFHEDHKREIKRLESFLIDNMDRSELKITEEEDIKILLELCMASLMLSVDHFNRRVANEEIIKKKFQKKLELIRHGVCK